MFYTNLLDACQAKGLKPTNVIRAVGGSNLADYKQGKIPKDTTLYLIAEELGVDPSELLDTREMCHGMKAYHGLIHGNPTLQGKLEYIRCAGEYRYDTLGKICGVTGPTFHRWIQGSSVPTISQLNRLAQKLDIPLYMLLDDTELVDFDCDTSHCAGHLFNIGRSLRCFRALHGEYAPMFARRFNVEVRLINNVELRTETVRADDLHMLAECTGLSIKMLCGDIESEPWFVARLALLTQGLRVRYLRLSSDMGLKELCGETGLSVTRICACENAGVALRESEVASFASAFGVFARFLAPTVNISMCSNIHKGVLR